MEAGHGRSPIPARPAVSRGAAVAGKFLAREGLVHHADPRLAEPHQADQRTPSHHAGDEGFGAIDWVEDPDVFCVGALGTVFLANDAMTRKVLTNQNAHGLFGGAVGGGDWIETAGLLVVDGQRCAEKRQNGIARNTGELVDETAEIDGCHTARTDCRLDLSETCPRGNRSSTTEREVFAAQ